METLYPEIHNLHHDMDIELKPSLTEANVQTHTVLMDIMEKCRKLRPEDCCKYCAVYSNNLTSLQQKEIERWRQDVNQAAYPKRSARVKSKGVIYHNYTPPGRPDETAGFRRVRTPKTPGSKPNTAPKKRFAKQRSRSNKKVIDLSLETISSRKYNRDGTPIVKDTEKDIPSVSVQETSVTILSHKAEADSAIISFDSIQDSEEMHARSTSNDLLNVITIDDCHMFHKYKKAAVIQDESSSLGSVKSPTEDSHNIRPVTGVRFNVAEPEIFSGTKSPLPPIACEHDDEDEYVELLTEPNETIIKALDNIIQKRNVTHNTAKRGLFKHEKGCRPLLQDNYESNRFKRLNDKLHQVMEDKYLVNPIITEKIKRYHLRHRSEEHGESVSPKLRVTTPEISRERQQARLTSITTMSNDTQHGNHDKDTAGANHESFLGILMDMDEGSAKPTKQT